MIPPDPGNGINSEGDYPLPSGGIPKGSPLWPPEALFILPAYAQALPVLVFGLGRLGGLDDQQSNKHGTEPKQHDQTGEIKFHGEPPQECIS